MGVYPSKPSRENGCHPSLTAPNHPIESSAAVVTMNQDIAFMVCAEVRVHDFRPWKLAYPPTALP